MTLLASFLLLSLELNFHILHGYNITFSKRSYFTGTSCDTPMTNLLNPDTLLICYEDLQVLPTAGFCKIAKLDTKKQTMSWSNYSVWETINGTDQFQLIISNTNTEIDLILSFINGNDSASGPGKSVYGKIINDKISWSSSYIEYNEGLTDQIILTTIMNDYFVICYSNGANDEEMRCKLGEYSTKDMTIIFSKNEYSPYKGEATDGMNLVKLTNTSFLICFAQGVNQIGACYIGSILDDFKDGIDSTITFNTQQIFNPNGGTDEVSINVIDENNLLLCYVSRDDGACTFGVLSNNKKDISFPNGNRNVFITNHCDETDAVIIPPNSLNNQGNVTVLLICYVDLSRNDNNGPCQFGMIDVANSNINFDGYESIYNTETTDEVNTIYLGGNMMMVCYLDVENADSEKNKGVCNFGSIS